MCAFGIEGWGVRRRWTCVPTAVAPGVVAGGLQLADAALGGGVEARNCLVEQLSSDED